MKYNGSLKQDTFQQFIHACNLKQELSCIKLGTLI